MPPQSPPTAFRARSTSQLPTEGDDSGGGARVDANQERPTTPPSRGGPVAMEAIQDVLQNEHEDPGQVALASGIDDGGDDSPDATFDYDYSDGGPVSEPEEEVLGEARRPPKGPAFLFLKLLLTPTPRLEKVAQ